MKPSEYKAIRENIGSTAKVARILETCTDTILLRESGKSRIKREAEYALRFAHQLEQQNPSAELVHVARTNPRRKR